VGTVHEIILKLDLRISCTCFFIEESTPLFSLLGTPRQEPSLLPWCNSGVAPRWPQLQFPDVERRFRDELQLASAVLRQGYPFRKGIRQLFRRRLQGRSTSDAVIEICQKPSRPPAILGSCTHESMSLLGSRLLVMCATWPEDNRALL
jgi:hypothetical protein